MNPIDMVFAAFSNLTGGLVDDCFTAIIAMVGLVVITAGARKLIRFLNAQALDASLVNLHKRNGGNGDFYQEYNRMKYKKLINHRLKLDLRGDL